MNSLRSVIPFSRISACHFTFERWRAGSLTELGIYTRYDSIMENKHVIRRHAIAYIEAEKLWVRPKKDCVAVMFFYEDRHFWTHLTRKEFDRCLK